MISSITDYRSTTAKSNMASKYFSKVSNLYKKFQTIPNFQRLAGICRVVEADEGRVKLEFEVQPEHTNQVNTLHGGYTATIIDIATTSALQATEMAEGGVTVDLHISYLSAAKVGDTVVVDARVTKQGRTMAFTRADVYRKADNRLMATALHTKAITPASKIASQINKI